MNILTRENYHIQQYIHSNVCAMHKCLTKTLSESQGPYIKVLVNPYSDVSQVKVLKCIKDAHSKALLDQKASFAQMEADLAATTQKLQTSKSAMQVRHLLVLLAPVLTLQIIPTFMWGRCLTTTYASM